MREWVTDAIVLGSEPSREHDRVVSLYTRSLGRIKARVAGGGRILSKFAPHLDPLNLVRVRLTHKNGFTLTDALTEDRFLKTRGTASALGNALRAITLVAALAPEHEVDPKLWHQLTDALADGRAEPNQLLQRFGYDARHAECDHCHAPRARYFATTTHTFWCTECSTRIPEHTLLLV